MRQLVRDIRDRLLGTEDSVCLQRARLVTEAWQNHEADPPPIRRAEAFAAVLRHMGLDVTSNPVFAGNTSSRPRAWMLIPEHGFALPPQVELENPCIRGILDDAIPAEIRHYWRERSFGGNAGIGHLAVDLHAVVHRGLADMLDEARRLADEGTEDQRTCRRAMAIALEGVIEWAGRYVHAAHRAAKAETDPLRRRCLQRVADACGRVPAEPARNLFEGLQAIALIQLAIFIEGHGMSVSVGLPDRVLEPFLADGFDAEEAADLVAAFLLKLTGCSLFGRGSKTQAVTVGGLDHTGRDRCNALTRCFLDAADLLRVGDPHVFLRWHEGMDTGVRSRAAELLAAGVSMPLLIGDEAAAGGFEQAGMAPEDAWDYCVIGCNELGVPGRCFETATATSGTVQYLALLNEVVLDEQAPPPAGADELLARLEAVVLDRARQGRRRGRERLGRLAERVPAPFTSALMRGGIARGADMHAAMPIRRPGLYERGLTNAANALAAIEQVIFRDAAATWDELQAALAADFEGADALRARLRAAPKWGNDDDRADRWALRLVELRERALDAVDAEFDDPPHTVCHVVRSLHHLDGWRIAASPDGRRACQPVCDSIGAETGTARQGATATLASVLKLDTPRSHRGGTNLNVTLPGGTDAPALAGLVGGFFARGGQELQVNCLDAATLRAARERPAEHGDLVVRVAGFSARFVDLPPVEQAELIARAEALD